jgi:hypothetical protein
MSRLDELKKLGDLRQSGVLTQEEFDQEKARLLAEEQPAQPNELAMPAPPKMGDTAASAAPQTAPSPPEVSLEDPLSEESAQDVLDWTKTANGLNLMYIGVAVVFLVGFLGGALAYGAKSQGLLMLVGLGVLGGAIAMVVGQIMLASIPEKSGAKSLGLTLAICSVVSVVLGIITASQDKNSQDGGLEAISSLLNLVVVIVFPIFVQKAAAFLGQEKLRKSAVNYLWFLGGCVLAAFILGSMVTGDQGSSEPPMIFGLIAIGAVVLWLIWYMRLIRELRDAIRQRDV